MFLLGRIDAGNKNGGAESIAAPQLLHGSERNLQARASGWLVDTHQLEWLFVNADVVAQLRRWMFAHPNTVDDDLFAADNLSPFTDRQSRQRRVLVEIDPIN